MMPSEMAEQAGIGKKNLEPRYYFLKMPTDFFEDKIMRKLRRLPGGDTYTIIALKILLLGATCDSRIYYDGLESSFAEEIALSIDEDAIATSIVIDFLLRWGWLVKETEDVILSEKSKEMTESISARTERWRRQKEREATARIAAQLPDNCRGVATEIEGEIEGEIEIEGLLRGKDLKTLFPDAFTCGKPKASPSLQEIQKKASSLSFHAISPESFHGYFNALGWTVDGAEITDWLCLYIGVEGMARRKQEGAE